MKLLVLPIMIIFLCACGTQETSTGMTQVETKSEMQCARDCETFHGGTVRGCGAGPSGATRSGSLIAKCVDDAYTALRSCYLTCK
jgi:hypothetical protein